MELCDLQKEVHKVAREKGWWSGPRNKLELLMLVITEVSEAAEEIRNPGGLQAKPYYLNEGSKKPEGWGIELADAMIRIMDMCEAFNVSLEEMIELKLEYNRTREFRHGGKSA